MSDVLVRALDRAALKKLKARAKEHGRSLQAEVKSILERAARASAADARVVAARIRRKLEGRRHTDSAKLLAEDRRKR